MEKMILCSLDHSQVYMESDFSLSLTIKNGTEEEWTVGRSCPVYLEIPVGEEPDDLAGAVEDLAIEAKGMQVEKDAFEGLWRIYGGEEEKVEPAGVISVTIKGKASCFSKTRESYMSGIRVYGTVQTESFCEFLPIYKEEQPLEILYFRAEGKSVDSKGCVEADLGEELVLQWNSVNAQACFLWPGGALEAGQNTQKVTVWQDTVYTLTVWDENRYIKKELPVVIRAPTERAIQKITTDTDENGAQIHIEYENASFSYVDRGVGRAGNSIQLQDYDGGEYYFAFFPGNKKDSGFFQLEEKDGICLEKLSYYYKQEEDKNVYHFRWRVSGGNGKLWIEKEGHRQEEKEQGEISFSSASDETIILTMGVWDDQEKEHIFYDLYPFKL